MARILSFHAIMRSNAANSLGLTAVGISTFYKWSSSSLLRAPVPNNSSEGSSRAAIVREASSSNGNRNAGSCMTTEVGSCRPDSGMDEAASTMWASDLSCLPVVDEGDRVVGIVTDRDICMAAFTQGKSLSAIPVREGMTRKVFTCADTDSIEQAVRTMIEHAVRRLPVVDSDGRLLGVVSRDDRQSKARLRKTPIYSLNGPPSQVGALSGRCARG
jgi:CBS domain-containing protein